MVQNLKYEWIYSHNNINWEELSNLYKVAPLGNKNPDDLRISFTNSMFKCFIYDTNRLIGVGRALADGTDCSYICDVAVLPNYQGTGLGKSIITELMTLSKNHKKIILYSVPGNEKFYTKLGFKKMNTAMAIFKDEKHALDSGLLTEQE